jgi:phenylacetate-coenzyme A ligase PaaK-like adenylate-forming protein
VPSRILRGETEPSVRHGRRQEGTAVAQPITTKDDLRRHLANMIPPGISLEHEIEAKAVGWIKTSGSSGVPLEVPMCFELDRVPADYETVWGQQPAKTRRTAVLTTPRCSATICAFGARAIAERTRWDTTLFLRTMENLFEADDLLVELSIEEMWEWKPSILLVNPYYLTYFALRAKAMGLDMPAVDLILASYQYCPAAQAKLLREMFNAPVRNTYVATDTCGSRMGIECCEGTWHVREDQVLLEVVDENGQPAHDIGKVLVTTANRVLPLLRYEVGDLARLTKTDCPCPLSDCQTFEFHGRASECLHLPQGRVTTKQFDDVMATIPGIAFYQCQQVDLGLVIDFVPVQPGDDSMTFEVIEQISETFAVPVRARIVDRLHPAESEKFPLIT